MRPLSTVPALLVLLAAAVPAQFITELDVRGRPRPPGIAPIAIDLHQVDVEVKDGVATTTVQQRFRNPNGMVLEGTYLFPIPEEAAVGGFEMMMGGKMVQGEVLEKDKAAGIYQGIVQRQRDPGLLEYVGRRLFQARVFPIPAQGTTEIRLSYTETLRRDGKTFEYRHPFKTRAGTDQPVARAVLAMTIRSEEPIRTVYSPSHQVEVLKQGDHEARITWEAASDPGRRDLVITYGLSTEGVGATLFTHAERGDEGAFLLLLAPGDQAAGMRTVAKDVLFVVDTSGSMQGEKIEQTREALRYCLRGLGEGDRFNLIPFATESRRFADALQPASRENVARAVAFVDELRAVGGTNINDALVEALGMSRDRDRPLLVIFMTDGEPTIRVTDTEEILKNVREANRALTRLFVFGVGDDVRTELLDQLAEQNQGARDYVGTKENIEVRISSFFEKVSSPVLSDVSLAFEGIRVTETYPKQLPDLFKGTQLLVTGRYEGKGTALIRLRGKVDGEPKEFVFERTLKPGGEETAFVPRLWAVRKVGYLMDQIRLHGESGELKNEVVRLGKAYGIVTPYTSYLVLEDEPVARERLRRGEEGERRRGRNGAPAPTRPSAPGGAGGAAGGGRGGVTPGQGFGAGAESAGQAPPAAAGAPVPEEEADAFLKDEARKRVASAAKGEPKARGDGGDGTGVPAPDPDEKARTSDNRDELPGRSKDKEAADEEEAKKELGRFLGTPVELSLTLKSFRESRADEGAGAGERVRRVGNRTFFHRYGVYVEAPVLDLDAKAIEQKLRRIEAFSAAYFELLKASPDLAGVLALGDNVLFVHGGAVIQIVPAPPPPTEGGR